MVSLVIGIAFGDGNERARAPALDSALERRAGVLGRLLGIYIDTSNREAARRKLLVHRLIGDN